MDDLMNYMVHWTLNKKFKFKFKSDELNYAAHNITKLLSIERRGGVLKHEQDIHNTIEGDRLRMRVVHYVYRAKSERSVCL
jgi:hypothetical protein